MTPETPLLNGSTSKQLTGLAVQRLIGDGRLALASTQHEVMGGSAEWQGLWGLTVRQMLAHTTGLSRASGNDQWGWRVTRAASLREGVDDLGPGDVVAEPGGSFLYSNTNYDLRGAIVEQVTGRPYADALADLVTGPLGLTRTTADLTALPADIARPYYTWLDVWNAPTPAPLVPSSVASSSVISTADDLAKVVLAHVTGGPPELRDALARSREPLVRGGDEWEYASGWYVRPLWEAHDRNTDALAVDYRTASPTTARPTARRPFCWPARTPGSGSWRSPTPMRASIKGGGGRSPMGWPTSLSARRLRSPPGARSSWRRPSSSSDFR